MKYLPLAALLLILFLVAAGFLFWELRKVKLPKIRPHALAVDARICASATIHGRTCEPDMSLLRTDRAVARWKRIYETEVDGLLADYERTEDAAVELRRTITLKSLTTQARRELSQDRRRR